MNRMEEIRVTRIGIDRIRVLLGNFLAGNPAWPLARADIVVLRSPPPWVLRFQMLGTFLSKLKSMYFVVSKAE